jgi:glutaredoxin
MKITIYTIKDCAFSKQEKDYLNLNKLTFEEKDLETNKEFLTEMLAVSNNFAGTPVTKIEKDDGSIVVLKGFTKEEFDTTFGLVVAPATTEPAKPTTDQPTTDLPAVASVKADSTDSTVPPTVGPVYPPGVDVPKSDELNSVLDKLEEKTAPESTPPQPPTIPPAITDQPTTNSTSSTNSTNSTDSPVPPSVDPTPPAIPDFPAK